METGQIQQAGALTGLSYTPAVLAGYRSISVWYRRVGLPRPTARVNDSAGGSFGVGLRLRGVRRWAEVALAEESRRPASYGVAESEGDNVRFFVAVTDGDWFEFVRGLRPDEVNFWKPGTTGFQAVPPGAPFLFKLHARRGVPGPIVGGGFFVRYSRLPVSLAWDAFGPGNGAPDLHSLRTRLERYWSMGQARLDDPDIGCCLLTAPFFLDERQWVPSPDDWAANIVQGKAYDDASPIGSRLWSAIEHHLHSQGVLAERRAEYDVAFSDPFLQHTRLGQGSFRIVTLESYGRRCSITGESTLPVLQAAHIRPVAEGGTHSPKNGLLLRADLHILFDQGLIGVSPDYRIQVSPRIRDAYLNGRVYYEHHNRELRSVPQQPALRPDPTLLEWHMDERFVR